MPIRGVQVRALIVFAPDGFGGGHLLFAPSGRSGHACLEPWTPFAERTKFYTDNVFYTAFHTVTRGVDLLGGLGVPAGGAALQVQNEMFIRPKMRSSKGTFTGPEHHFLEPRKSVLGA